MPGFDILEGLSELLKRLVADLIRIVNVLVIYRLPWPVGRQL